VIFLSFLTTNLDTKIAVVVRYTTFQDAEPNSGGATVSTIYSGDVSSSIISQFGYPSFVNTVSGSVPVLQSYISVRN